MGGLLEPGASSALKTQPHSSSLCYTCWRTINAGQSDTALRTHARIVLTWKRNPLPCWCVPPPPPSHPPFSFGNHNLLFFRLQRQVKVRNSAVAVPPPLCKPPRCRRRVGGGGRRGREGELPARPWRGRRLGPAGPRPRSRAGMCPRSGAGGWKPPQAVVRAERALTPRWGKPPLPVGTGEALSGAEAGGDAVAAAGARQKEGEGEGWPGVSVPLPAGGGSGVRPRVGGFALAFGDQSVGWRHLSCEWKQGYDFSGWCSRNDFS